MNAVTADTVLRVPLEEAAVKVQPDIMFMNEKKTFSQRLRKYVDGEANTTFEFFMLFVVLVNTVSLGLETSPSMLKYEAALFWTDQVCLYLFILELIIKAIAYNRHFFGEFRSEKDSNAKVFHLNKWNIFDLMIVIISTAGSLPFFSVFRVIRLFKSIKIVKGLKSLRVVKVLKLVNGIKNLRIMVKAIIKAFPSVLWTFVLLLIFTYVYAVIGTNVFGLDFPDYFGSLKLSFFSLFGLTSVDSADIIARFSWAWLYFVSYSFFEASIIMNVIVGVIVDAVNTSRNEEDKDESKNTKKEKVTLETLSAQIQELQNSIGKLKKS